MTSSAESHAGPHREPAFQQKIGPFDAIMLVVGTIIGSGIFIVSADISRDVGTAGWLLTVGIVLFSGSLYALAVSGTRLLGAVTPFGGVCFLAGWVCVILASARMPN